MRSRYLLALWLVAPGVASAAVGIGSGERAPVPLCRALERLGPGDRIPVVVSGIYGIDYLFDPEEPTCRLDVDPNVCVEFAADVELPPAFAAIHKESLRIFATFRGVLHGSELDPEINDPSIPVTARLAASNRSRFCASLYRSKLVVDSILSFEEVPPDHPWTESSRGDVSSQPLPLEMALPAYPWTARVLQTEGAVLMEVEVVGGTVAGAAIQFGDPILAEEAVANVKTWRFEPSLSARFTVEFEFRLEKRPATEGSNPEFEMRLPNYVKVVGARRNW